MFYPEIENFHDKLSVGVIPKKKFYLQECMVHSKMLLYLHNLYVQNAHNT